EAAAPAEAELPRKLLEAARPKEASAGAPEPARPREAAPEVAPPRAALRAESRPAIAILEPGRDILGGERIETRRETGVLRFPDGTRLELSPGTVVRGVTVERGKRVEIERGGVAAEVPKQPVPMVFATPQAEAMVLGTTLRLAVDGKSTRLEVLEGRVRLTRLSDRKSVDVAAGFFAVAAAGSDCAANRIVDEVFLAPVQGRIRGNEWRLVRDPLALDGQALEAPRVKTAPSGKMDLRNRRTDFVEFAFVAEADKDYSVWVRGAATAPVDKTKHDAVGLEVLTGHFVRPSSWPEVAAFGGHEFNGWGHRAGWWWIGGDADPDTPADRSDAVPATVRFSRHGVQVLRLLAIESPLRIDAIWLSTTQKSRPEPERRGPGR
ncbi:MAG: FecR family protein, partial [Planctomycetota bacterium]